MDTTALDRLRRDFGKAHVEKWGAILSSVGSALTYLLLLVLLYLFVDLLVWQGRIPHFAQLDAAAKQREFAAEWAARSEADRIEAAVPNRGERGTRPRDGRRAPRLQPAPTPRRVGTAMAGRALTSRSATASARRPRTPTCPSEAADDDRTQLAANSAFSASSSASGTAGPAASLGWLASWNSWTWRPGSDGSANLTYLTGLFILAFGVALVRGVLVNALAYLSAAVVARLVTRLRRAIYLHTYRLGSLAVRTVGSAEAAQPLHEASRRGRRRGPRLAHARPTAARSSCSACWSSSCCSTSGSRSASCCWRRSSG